MILKTLFPQGEANGNDPWSINGLMINAIPQNCEVVEHFLDKYTFSKNKEMRIHFLVKHDNCFYHIRVCQAMENSGYEAYAVVIDSGIGAVRSFKRMKFSDIFGQQSEA